MSKKWLRFADLKARGLVNNRTTLARWIRDYNFPPGTNIGPNTRAWTDEEIETYEAARTAAEAPNAMAS
jgi:predicted DNA-binding transcriptional regulator AlpA